MGILSKILADEPPQEIKISSAKISHEKNNISGSPTQPCPVRHEHSPGLHHWRDSYGEWHCTECFPPAVMAMVREECVVGREDIFQTTAPAVAANFCLATGFLISSIQPAGGKIVFSPETSQAHRREILETLAWFERSDARVQKHKK